MSHFAESVKFYARSGIVIVLLKSQPKKQYILMAE